MTGDRDGLGVVILAALTVAYLTIAVLFIAGRHDHLPPTGDVTVQTVAPPAIFQGAH